MPAGPSPSSVLVVDDDKEVADLYATWLQSEYVVFVAYSGATALEILADRVIDVVLLDRKLPDLSGDDVLVTLRDWGLEARVAMVSGKEPETDIIDLGFDDYVVKPVERSEYLDTVERLISIPSYDAIRRELTELRVKRNVIETELPDERLESDERYQDLLARIDELEMREEAYRQPESGTAVLARL